MISVYDLVKIASILKIKQTDLLVAFDYCESSKMFNLTLRSNFEIWHPKFLVCKLWKFEGGSWEFSYNFYPDESQDVCDYLNR